MKTNKGQALLIVVLSLSVVLTIVLFILSRSVTDISISSQEEEASRAFSAAEAGIEKALVAGTGVGSTTIGDANYSVSVVGYAKGSNSFVYPTELMAGDTAIIWFAAQDSDSTSFTGEKIKICWGKPDTDSGSSTAPAIEASFIYLDTPGSLSSAQIGRSVSDPNSSRSASNFFEATDAGTCQIAGENFAFQKTLTFADLGITSADIADGLQFGKVRVYYNNDQSTKVGFDLNFPGNSLLPSQGLLINSSGAAGQSNRKVEVFQGWPEVPEIFDFSIFSASGVSK